jgi:hypothetical protein
MISDPDELLQFDAAAVAIQAGNDAETLSKLKQPLYQLIEMICGNDGTWRLCHHHLAITSIKLLMPCVADDEFVVT